MLKTGFSVQGASLRLLRANERGVITRITSLCDKTALELKQMGLTLGQTITVEQRFPRFIVRLGNFRHALNEAAMNAIYVRIINH